jgi:ankyrin repeat protein
MKKAIKVIISSILVLVIFTGATFAYGLYAAEGYKELQQAAEDNDLVKAKSLLKWGVPASPNVIVANFDYFSVLRDTPLHFAAKNGHYEMAKLLIDNGATLDWCCCSCVTALHRAILNKHPDVVRLLLESGASKDRVYDLTHSVVELARLKSTPEIMAIINAHNK